MRRTLLLIIFAIAATLAPCGCASDSSSDGIAARDASASPSQQASPAPDAAQAADPFASVPRVSVKELAKALEEGRAAAVDVRPAEAFEEEHIAGAFSIPEEEVKERAGELPRGKLVVTYCA